MVNKNNTTKVNFQNILLYGVATLSLIGVSLGLYSLLSTNKVKYFHEEKITEKIQKKIKKKLAVHTYGLRREFKMMYEEFMKQNEILNKQKNAPEAFKKKVAMMYETVRLKQQEIAGIEESYYVNLAKEMIDGRYKKAVQVVKKRNRCNVLLPIPSTVSLEACIDPKDDLTQQVLDEMDLLDDSKEEAVAPKKEEKPKTEGTTSKPKAKKSTKTRK